jgi:hypothetical protein
VLLPLCECLRPYRDLSQLIGDTSGDLDLQRVDDRVLVDERLKNVRSGEL